MKKALTERIIVAVLFVLVITIFLFAERDTKKLVALHTKNATALPKLTAESRK